MTKSLATDKAKKAVGGQKNTQSSLATKQSMRVLKQKVTAQSAMATSRKVEVPKKLVESSKATTLAAEASVVQEILCDDGSSATMELLDDDIIVEERPLEEIHRQMSSSKASPVKKVLEFDAKEDKNQAEIAYWSPVESLKLKKEYT